MANVALGAIGAGVGSIFGDPLGGFSAGWALAGILFPERFPAQERGRLDDVRATGASYGPALPRVWGKVRVGGNIIWSAPKVENTRKTRQGGKGGGGGSISTIYYTQSVAVAFCAGEATITKIWAGDLLVYDAAASPTSKHTIRPYTGTTAQTVDSAIAAQETTWTAYRGVVYAVFQALNLEEWGNQLPSFNAEVDATQSYAGIVGGKSGLQVYYQFEASPSPPGTLGDSSGNGRDLVTATETPVVGRHGSGIFTDSSDLKVVTGNVAALEGTQVTVSLFYRWDGVSSLSTDEFMYWDPVSGLKAWQVYIDWFSEQIKLNTSCTAAGSSTTLLLAGFTRDTDWHNAVFTVQCGDASTGRYRLYIDGVLVDDQPGNPIITSLAIPSSASKEVRFTGGGITHTEWDEVAVTNTIWAESEVTQAFEVAGVTVGSILAAIFAEAGVTAYETDRATDTLDGYILAQRRPYRELVDPLLRVFLTDLAEVDYQLVAVRRGAESLLTIDAAHLGSAVVASNGRSQPRPRLETRRLADLELPQRLAVSFFDPARNHLQNTQEAIRSAKAAIDDAVTVNTPIYMSADQARQQAQKLLWAQWWERTVYRFSLPPKYAQLAPGSVCMLPVNGTNERVRIVAVDIGLPGELRFTAVPDDEDLQTQAILGGAATIAAPAVSAVVATTFRVWSGPQVRDADGFQPGFYAVGTGATGWRGGTIYYSPNGGTDWLEAGTVTKRGTFGETTTALDDGASTTVVDNTSDVDVTLQVTGSLTSTTQAEVDAGENAALIGSEIVGFKDAQALGGLSHRLTNYRRGRRGTVMTGHGSTEPFVLLESDAVVRCVVSADLIGQTLPVKVVSPGQSLGDVTAQNVTIATPTPPVEPVDIQATAVGAQLVSTDGSTMDSLLPLTTVTDTFAGQLVNEEGDLLYADA